MASDQQGFEASGQSGEPVVGGPKRGSLRWLWFLLGGVLVVVILCCGGIGLLVYKGMGIIKQSDPYKLTWEEVRKHPEVIEKLGEPIEEASRFPTGEFHIENGGGEAKLFFQIKGPKGTAQVQSECQRVQGNWGGTVTVIFDDDERLPIPIGARGALPEAPPFVPGGAAPE